jgi:microsomal prostaglandin-E synthase 2
MQWSERLAVMIYPNITRNFDEAWQCFGYTTSVQSWGIIDKYSNRILGPIAMYLTNGKVKKKYGIIHEREEMLAYLKEWVDAIQGRDFLHGSEVTMPDLLVFSVLRSIEGLTTFEDIMSKDENLRAWYGRVDSSVKSCEN